MRDRDRNRETETYKRSLTRINGLYYNPLSLFSSIYMYIGIGLHPLKKRQHKPLDNSLSQLTIFSSVWIKGYVKGIYEEVEGEIEGWIWAKDIVFMYKIRKEKRKKTNLKRL